MKTRYYPVTKEMSAWILQSRKTLGLTQSMLCQISGIGQADVSTLELGKKKNVRESAWKKLSETLKNAPPIGDAFNPEKNYINVDAVRKEVLAIKNQTKASWDDIASACGVHTGTLHVLMRANGSPNQQSLSKIRDGIDKGYRQVADKLVQDGIVVKERVRRRATTALALPMKQPRVVNHDNGLNLPSLIELDLRELEVIGRIRAYLLGER